MKIIQSYKNGWAVSLNSKRMTTLMYLVNLFLALLLMIPFYGLFNSIAGTSMLPEKLISDFDATAFGDFLRDGGKAFAFYLKGIFPWLILFLLIGIFYQGGIISWVSNSRGSFSTRRFINQGIKYFWPFAKTSFYNLIIQALFALLVYLPVALIFGEENPTDQFIGRTLLIAIPIHIVLLIFGTMIAEYTRFFIFRSGKRKVLKMLWKALKFCIRKFFKLFGIYTMWVMIPLALLVAFYFIRINWSINTGLMVFLLFLVQQVFIWLRVLLRIQKTGMFYSYLIYADKI